MRIRVRGFLAAIAALAALGNAGNAWAAWVAYNDLNQFNDNGSQNVNATDWGYPNTWTSGALIGGSLKDISSGSVLGATVSFSNANIQPNMSIRSTQPTSGDASVFNGALDSRSAISYSTGSPVGTAGNVYLVLDFTGLDSTKSYDFTAFGDRGNSAYSQLLGNGGRWVKATISDYDSYTWNNSTGISANNNAPQTYVSGDSTYMNTGYNPDNYVIRLSSIKTGLDGDFSIAFENSGTLTLSGIAVNTTGAYMPGVFRLEEVAVPEPSSLVMLAFGSVTMFWLVRRKRRMVV